MKTSTRRMIAKKDGPIGWMQFNNPARHNAVSVDMWKSVPEIMTKFENDDQIRVVVLSGAGGKSFISGADISEFEEKHSMTKKPQRLPPTPVRPRNSSLIRAISVKCPHGVK